MEVEIINQFMLSLFFIYLLLTSANMNTLLSCSTQRFLKDSLVTKHLILFASIYILTFILNWYTPGAIVVKEEEEEEKKKEGFGNLEFSVKKYSYLISSFNYSLIIYFVFLATTKMETFYFISFIFLLIFVFVIFLLYKVNLSEINLDKIDVNTFLISKDTIIKNIKDINESIEIKDKEMNNVVMLYNILTISYLIVPIIMIMGVYNYYVKQVRDKNIKFNLLKFIFGTNKCRDV